VDHTPGSNMYQQEQQQRPRCRCSTKHRRPRVTLLAAALVLLACCLLVQTADAAKARDRSKSGRWRCVTTSFLPRTNCPVSWCRATGFVCKPRARHVASSTAVLFPCTDGRRLDQQHLEQPCSQRYEHSRPHSHTPQRTPVTVLQPAPSNSLWVHQQCCPLVQFAAPLVRVCATVPLLL
jgi:hypothetical protein